MADEYYSHEQIKKIISKLEIPEEVGYVNYLSSTEKPKEILVRGYVNQRPSFINDTDRRLWIEHWNLTGEPSNISYSSNLGEKVFPTLFRREMDEVNYAEVMSSVKLMRILLLAHAKATIGYHEKVAQPFIQERSKLIQDIIEGE